MSLLYRVIDMIDIQRVCTRISLGDNAESKTAAAAAAAAAGPSD